MGKTRFGFQKMYFTPVMGHVRLPLISKNYILKNVVKEPLLKSCLKCKDYVIEALDFHLNKSDELITVTQNSRTKPRFEDNVIFVIGGYDIDGPFSSTEWYDPKVNQWQFGPEMITPRRAAGLALVNDNSVFAVGGFYLSRLRSVALLDLSSESPCWKPTVDMLVKRDELGVGVINNYLYAVGGFHGNNSLNSAEVYDCNTQTWSLISNMSTRRSYPGVGVLNNLLYVVGGFDSSSRQRLNSVECYRPRFNMWTPVAQMCVRRSRVCVGVLNGVLYAVGGWDGHQVWSSVEAYRPSTGVWAKIANMHLSRQFAGVVALNGLLYVVGGNDGTFDLDSAEFYNPNTNTWTMVAASMNVPRQIVGVIAIDRPQHFKTC